MKHKITVKTNAHLSPCLVDTHRPKHNQIKSNQEWNVQTLNIWTFSLDSYWQHVVKNFVNCHSAAKQMTQK